MSSIGFVINTRLMELLYCKGDNGMENKPIFKKDLALSLVRLGNELMDVTTNSRNPKYLIFYFKYTDKLKKDMELLNSYK